MDPWFRSVAALHGAGEDTTHSREAYEAASHIDAAAPDMPDVRQVILFDLGEGQRVRWAAMNLPHRHGQDCNRA